MKKHRMPFRYWEDDHTKLIRETKGPEFVDPEYYTEAHIREDERWPHRYFLNNRCWDLMKRHGPFKDRYRDCEELVDSAVGESAFIVCPGPSMEDVDIDAFSGQLTIAVNSAGFAFDPTYWCMAESGYARWLVDSRFPQQRAVIATARVAVVLRGEEKKQRREKFRSVHVLRWEEERIVPPRTPAVSVTNALVTAWQMGCKEAYLIGLDLAKLPGRPYAHGLPHTKEGASNPFDDQIKALTQFSLPGFKVMNCSPYSVHTLENFESFPLKYLKQRMQCLK